MTTLNHSQHLLLETKELTRPDKNHSLKAIRPTEFHGAITALFVSLFAALIITLAILFSTSRIRGELRCLALKIR
jgi:hypothetical protein